MKKCIPTPHCWSRVVFLLVLLSYLPASAELLDRVVAAVNKDVITQSELELAVKFNAALGGAAGPNVRSETLEGIINRKLLVQEAYRLKFVDVTEQDIAGEVDKLKKRLGSDKAFADFLAKLDLTPEELERMLTERFLVERFIEKKIGLFIRVGREEALEYFQAHPDRFKGRQFQEVQKQITSGLAGQKLDQQLSRYLAELRSKAEIRVGALKAGSGESGVRNAAR